MKRKYQKFKIILSTSNPNIEDVRKILESKISNWLDNISFTTGKNEICKKVEILDK